MYTILSTYPPHASGNVGDKLLEEQAQNLIRKETGVDEFNILQRKHDLTSQIDKINESDAIILPAFAIREPIHPNTYALTENLDSIEAPLIPLAANWTHYPGDQIDNESLQYQPATVSFIERLIKQPEVERLTTRDAFTKRILQRHGFTDATVVGDLGWYHDDYMGEPMRIPDSIDHIVMTTPHNAHYLKQAEDVMDMLLSEFPNAKFTCSFHSSLSESDKKLRAMAEDRGFDIVLASHDTDNIEFYDDCDLHVGYRLHGHISFLRRRLPSVLIGEDGRGNGFNATLGVGGFQATRRRLGFQTASGVHSFASSIPGKGLKKIAETKLNIDNPYRQIIAPPDMTVPSRIRDFLQHERESGFSSYDAVPKLFDETYEENMKPFLESLPK